MKRQRWIETKKNIAGESPECHDKICRCRGELVACDLYSLAFKSALTAVGQFWLGMLWAEMCASVSTFGIAGVGRIL